MVECSLDENEASPATAEALKHGRRLSDKILIAFDHACNVRDISTAEELLGTLGRLIARPVADETHDRRKVVETLVDANYRLWDLKREQMPASDTDATAAPSQAAV